MMDKIRALITMKTTMNSTMRIWTNKAIKTSSLRAERTTATNSSETTPQRKISGKARRKKMSFQV